MASEPEIVHNRTISQSAAYRWMIIAQDYNVFTGANLSHTQMREMINGMGEIEKDDLFGILRR